MDIFTERFNEVLQFEQINQANLANQIGIARQCITDYKSGKSFPTIQTLARICDMLDISSDYLLGLEDDFGTRTSATTNDGGTPSYSPEERKMLEQYRSLPKQLQQLVRDQLEVYCSSNDLKNTIK